MDVLVIGGTGRIGPFVIHALLERGHDVTIVHRGRRALPPGLVVREVLVDRRDSAAFAARMRRESPEVVVDLFPGRAEDTQAVVEAFRGRIRSSVHISAFDVYEQYAAVDLFGAWQVAPAYQRELAARPIPVSEDAPLRSEYFFPHPQVVAGFDKVLVELELQRARVHLDFPSTVLRLAAIYGPMGYSLQEPRLREWYFVKRVLDGRRQIAVPGSGAGLLHRVHYANAARAVVLAAESPAAVGHAYNVGDTQLFTLRQIADRVAMILGHEWEMVQVPRSWVAGWHALDADPPFILDLVKIQTGLQYQDAVPAERGLEETVAYLADAPPRTGLQDFDYSREDAIISRAREALGG